MVPHIKSRPAAIAFPGELPTASLSRPQQTIGVGVVGYGYWGPNLVRNFGMTCARLGK